MKPSTSHPQLLAAIRAAGLANGIVCLHSSLKSFGHLEGGADALIRAFLDLGCTLVAPAFTYDGEVPPPPGRQLRQNGGASFVDSEHTALYDKNSAMIARDMGAIPARLLEMPGRARGEHPVNSFAALGPSAAELIATQTLLDVYGPLKALYAHPLAWLALVGVGLTRATCIHLAEEKAGRRLFRRWTKGADGAPQEVAVGSCSEGFDQLDSTVKEIETTLTVGESRWRIYPFGAFVDAVTAAILQNPQITHCADPHCARCNDAVRGGPLL